MTVAARIEVQVAGHAGPAQGQVQNKPPSADSFRSKWQEQLASLSGGSEGSSGSLETGEESTGEIASGGSHDSMFEQSPPLLSQPLKLSGAQQGAQVQPAMGRPLIVVSKANTGFGTGAPGTGRTIAQGLGAASPKIETGQPEGSSSPVRTVKSEGTKAAVAAKNQRPTAGDGASSATATPTSAVALAPIQIPASEIRNTAPAQTNSEKVEIRTPSSSPPEADALMAAPGISSLVESSRSAADSGGLADGNQTVLSARLGEVPTRLGEMGSAPRAASKSIDSKSIAAQDSKGIEPHADTFDEEPAHAATQVESSTGNPSPAAIQVEGATANPAPAPVYRASTAELTPGPETHHAPAATTAAQAPPSLTPTSQTPPVQVAGGGMVPVAGRELDFQAKPVPVAEPNEDNLALKGGNSPSLPGAKRSQHAACVTQERGSPAQAQFGAGPGDATTLVHDPAAAVRGQTNPAAGGAAAAEPPLRETFAALDSDVAPGALTWTHASARQAEAGFQDSELGWIGVRADRNGGGVHAELVPGSADAARELGAHLDGLNGYLTAQHMPVESLRMAAPEGNFSSFAAGQAADNGTGQGTGQGMGQGEHPGAGQNTPQQGYSEAKPAGMIHSSERAATVARLDQPVQMNSAAQSQSSRGVYISVVA
jgi:hypothetical protein